MPTTNATATDTKSPLIDTSKAQAQDSKVLGKADVRDRLLLELADNYIAHPEGLKDRVSSLRDELADDIGLSNLSSDGQIVQHPAARAEERQANIDLAVASAKAAGLVADDHKPGDGDPTAPKAKVPEPHPDSDTPPVTVSIPAGVPAAEVKPDKPMDPTKK